MVLKKKFIKKKNVVGVDIKPVYPKNPHVTIVNDFKNDLSFLSNEMLKKTKKILKKN